MNEEKLIFYVFFLFSCHRFKVNRQTYIFAVANKDEGRIFIFFISVSCIEKVIDGSTRKNQLIFKIVIARKK